MPVSLEGLPGKVCGSARFEDEKEEAWRMLERTGRSGQALLTIPPKYYFSLLLITGSVVLCMIAFLTKRCLKRSDTKEQRT
jgi:hypothetical protein